MFDSSDVAWQKFGANDPYFGVVSHQQFHKERLNDAALYDFFRGGEQHIATVMQTIHRHVAPTFSPKRSLDFGCGVGRLVIPLAELSEIVHGVDVSEAMLAEARKNCASRGISNVTFYESDDQLSKLEGNYDFVHSFIVFQHIHCRRGERIFRRLLQLLNQQGVGAIHVTFKIPFAHLAVQFLIRYIPFAGAMKNVLQGKSPSAPRMNMNAYNIGRLFCILREQGITGAFAQFSNHSGHVGAMLYFRKD